MAAIKAWPGGLQVGGGINPTNAKDFLDAGASHVIVTSYVFRDGTLGVCVCLCLCLCLCLYQCMCLCLCQCQ